MQDVVSTPARVDNTTPGRSSRFASVIRAATPSLVECAAAVASALILIFAFPDFNLWPLAWLALVPLLFMIARNPRPWPAFVSGWLFGAIFFFGTCHWLSYSMIQFGEIPAPLAYLMLVPGALVLGLFTAMFAMTVARAIRKWGTLALFVAPFAWPALEWARLEVTGQLWNAIGYSQAYQLELIQAARWGGVYAVGFLLVAVNAAIVFVLVKRSTRSLLMGLAVVAVVAAIILVTRVGPSPPAQESEAVVVAIQPNVPMDLVKSLEELASLNARHFELSEAALSSLLQDGKPRLVIWPESPMNFTYGTDRQLRERLAVFAARHGTSVLLNSQEVAPNDGLYNSAVLINEHGSLVAQYDKIRLMPFGEYVPLPRWLPGAGLITAIVGDFTAGENYRQMQVGTVKTGIFICIESAYPNIARRFTREGADVLINISNDGYLGPTAVMRQHLANAVFRAVENGRPLLRVTNTGITAFITSRGEIRDATAGFQQEVRTWHISRASEPPTFYAAHGDWFVAGCAAVSLMVFAFSFAGRRQKTV